ncbi:MAG TPA: ribosome silencing factor [Actinobacteria bacterium]|jgi:ribosome-associated protein|nr:ribosome silencing factor [Actinomycetota bacterium]HCP62771.1 ribosome silencing factor [Actinomycetota bacterium]
MACEAARAATNKQADDIMILDVSELITITDYFVICSGGTERQLDTVAEAVVTRLAGLGVKPVRREGERGERWLLLDFVDFVVHILHTEEREFYRLENLWRDAPVVEWEHERAAAAETATEASG